MGVLCRQRLEDVVTVGLLVGVLAKCEEGNALSLAPFQHIAT